jgi:hypothetical protein
MKKLTRGRVVPIISAGVTWVDLRDQAFWFPRHAKFRHQEMNSGQAPFARVETLVNQISLGTIAAGKKTLKESIGERMLFMQHADHLPLVYFEGDKRGNRGDRRQVSSHRSGDRFFSNKVACAEKEEGSIFTRRRDPGPALLQIEDGVGFPSLRKEHLACLQSDDTSAQAGTRQKSSASKFRCFGSVTRVASFFSCKSIQFSHDGTWSGIPGCQSQRAVEVGGLCAYIPSPTIDG